MWRLVDAAVEKYIVILYHLHHPVSTKRCPRCAAVEPDITLRSEVLALNKEYLREEKGVHL